jgi:hypothetical protein
MNVNENTATSLQGLGFENEVDFVLYHYEEEWGIRWLSSEPIPTDEELEQGYQAWINQREAREALRQSMISKLATTLTPEETALLEELL